MGFFDSMKKGFEDEAIKNRELREKSNYKTEKELEQERSDKFNQQSSGVLSEKLDSIFETEDNKKIIFKILKRRGCILGNDLPE